MLALTVCQAGKFSRSFAPQTISDALRLRDTIVWLARHGLFQAAVVMVVAEDEAPRPAKRRLAQPRGPEEEARADRIMV